MILKPAAVTDLAVVRVSVAGSKLHPLTLADSSSAAVGDGVLAIGSPFGLSETLTTGIVSALDRSIQSPSGATISGAIQTDASINPGSGFAIPSNTVRKVAATLISGDHLAVTYRRAGASHTATAVLGAAG
jgi:S1-C subfamily serine protease